MKAKVSVSFWRNLLEKDKMDDVFGKKTFSLFDSRCVFIFFVNDLKFEEKDMKKEKSNLSAIIILELYQIVHNFKKMNRAGWNKKAQNGYSKTAVKDSESDADHSYGLMFLCLFIGEALGLDVVKMLIMAFLHDLPEAITGDQITALERDPEKRRLIEAEKEEREKQALWDMLSILDSETRDKYFNYYLEYLKRESPEAKIVYQLDKIETILQSYFYYSIGEEVSPMEFISSYEDRINEPLLQELLSLIKQKLETEV